MKRRELFMALPALAAVNFISSNAPETNQEQTTGPVNPYPEPLLADDVTGTDAFAKWHAWEQAHS